MQRTVKQFNTFAEAEKADREFYKRLTGNERLQILVELLNHAPEQRLREFVESLNSSRLTRSRSAADRGFVAATPSSPYHWWFTERRESHLQILCGEGAAVLSATRRRRYNVRVRCNYIDDGL